MIIRRLDEMVGTERDVPAPTWNSRRFILADDRVGFSLHDTIIQGGTETYMWYKHHIEAVYCIRGRGTLEDVETGAIHDIQEGTMYLLEKHDKHILRTETEMQMVCVFNPPCTGREVHDDEGVYPLLTVDGAAAETSEPAVAGS